MTKEQLLRKVKHLKINDIEYILESLGKESDLANTEKVEIAITEISDEDIALIRELLILMVDEDNNFQEKLQEIIENDDRTRMADMFADSDTMVAIVTLGTIAINLIKAKYPSEEITTKDKDGNTSKIVRRNDSSISDALKPLTTFLAEKKKNKEEE